MNCLIVDDNKIARTTLRQMAGKVRDLTVTGIGFPVPASSSAANYIPLPPTPASWC